MKSEIQAINRKLDQILAILNDATVEAQEEPEEEISENLFGESDEVTETESTDIE